jgi:hypothetical protein
MNDGAPGAGPHTGIHDNDNGGIVAKVGAGPLDPVAPARTAAAHACIGVVQRATGALETLGPMFERRCK